MRTDTQDTHLQEGQTFPKEGGTGAHAYGERLAPRVQFSGRA